MSKVAAIAFACAGIGFADLLCIDAWLLPAVVASQPHASGSAGMAAAGLIGVRVETAALAEPAAIEPRTPLASAQGNTVASAQPVVTAMPRVAAAAPIEAAAPVEPVAPIMVADANPAVAAKPAAPEPRAIYFIQTGAAEPDAAAQAELDELARRLRDDRALEISVHGHADARGSRVANHRLSKQRAQAVARVLQRDGIAAKRILLAWYGERKPAVAGAGDEAWAANRRVELRVHRSE